jgi:ubiquinone/menaquinone biosynthesis C-methylase UbiE
MSSDKTFVPAAGHDWLLPLYDPLVSLLGASGARRQLLEQADLRAGQRVLDVGCGTGTFAIAIKEAHPGVEVMGIDPDQKALARALRKVRRQALSVRLERGFATAIPHRDGIFDRVFTSFVLHHLASEQKLDAMREIRRVLRPGGSLHLLDFMQPDPNKAGFLARHLHAGEHLRENTTERIFGLLHGAGFVDVRELAQRTLLLGPVAYYRATAPDSAARSLN